MRPIRYGGGVEGHDGRNPRSWLVGARAVARTSSAPVTTPISRATPKRDEIEQDERDHGLVNLPDRRSSSAGEEQPADADADRVEDGGEDQRLGDQRHHSPSQRTPETPGYGGDAAVDAGEIAEALALELVGMAGEDRLAAQRVALEADLDRAARSA